MGRKNHLTVNKPLKDILDENSLCILESKCIEWQGKIDITGYGRFYKKGKKYSVHRAAFEENMKREIQKGFYILHSCDNRKCLNPAHLREGTHYDNMQDMKERGGFVVGEKHGMNKLKECQVLEIICLISQGKSNIEISKIFNVSRYTINDIKLGKRWNWLTKIK